MSLENWFDILVKCYASFQKVPIVLSTIYLFSWIFIGNYVLLNLFLAILMDGFDNQKTKEEIDEYEEIKFFEEEKQKILKIEEVEVEEEDEFNEYNLKDSENIVEEDKKKSLDQIFCNYSLFIFSKDNILRKFCFSLYFHRYFDKFIILLIIISSGKLVVMTYLDENNFSVKKGSEYFDLAFTFLFLIEALIKTISLGFIFHSDCYLRENWSQLDFLIVIISLLDLILPADLAFLKIMRLFRILRPLRFISHNKSMKILVTTLLSSFSDLMNVVVVMLLIWLIFAILGINLLKNKLGYCNIDNYYNIGRSRVISTTFFIFKLIFIV